jgi:hypothetical protein
MALIIGSSQGLLPGYVDRAQSAIAPMSPQALGRLVRAAALQAGFRKVDFEDGEQGRFVGARRSETVYLKNVGETTLLVCWIPNKRYETLVEWVAYRQQGYGSHVDSVAMARFLSAFEFLIDVRPPPPPPPLKEPVVWPGEPPPKNYEGQIWDYSALARAEDLGAFRHGVLPLGQWAFGWGEETRYGPQLFMPLVDRFPAEERGVLICAPQGSGKTHLLVRWAAAAIRTGRSVFLVDVKGNLRKYLEEAMARIGVSAQIVHFTTAPHAASDRINFLSGISAGQIDVTEQLHRLGSALLPAEGLQGEEQFRHDVAIRLAVASMKLLKLMHWYSPGDFATPDGVPREPDLADLLALVENEEEMMRWIDWIREKEAWDAYEKTLSNREKCQDSVAAPSQLQPNYSVAECVTGLAIALGQEYLTLQPSSEGNDPLQRKLFVGGQRSREYTYDQYMLSLIKALEPFRPNRPIGPRIRSFGPGREFRFQDFGMAGQPVVVLLTAREQDSALATAVLGMAVRRLRNVLDERRNQPGFKGEVLLLLDETKRIAGFDPLDFVTVIRDGRVGYVLVYQELSLISQVPDRIGAVLANIGTQIYLQSIFGNDLDRFNKQFFERHREREMPSFTRTPDGRQVGTALTIQTVPFLESNAAFHLPGGVKPALIYVRGGPPPFIVDLYEASRSGLAAPQLT